MREIITSEINLLIEKIYDEVWQENPWIRSLEALRLLIPCNTMAIEVMDSAVSMATYYFAAGRRVESSDIGVWEERNADEKEEILVAEGDVRVCNDWRQEKVNPGFLYLVEKYDVLRSMSVGIVDIDGVGYSLHSGRSITEPAFDDYEQEIFRLISGHLSRAIRLRLQLGLAKTTQDLQADAMERLSVGGMIIDGRGHIAFANETAERFMQERDGLKRHRGRLQATGSAANERLQKLIADVLSGRSSCKRFPVRAISVPRSAGARDLYLVLREHCIRDSVSDRLKNAIQVYIHDPGMKYCENATIYQQLFKFTRTEAAIAAALANGSSVEEVEAGMAISHNTMRAHLRSMFNKTDVNSRTDLLRLLVNSAAPLAGKVNSTAPTTA
jgi:DNA-binding CsgD family transcriptional regulator